MMNQEQIEELIDRSRQNDTIAFAQLVSEFQTMVFRLAFRLLCNEDETRDMVQEIFVKIWLSLDKYDGRCRFTTWMYKITCNTCYDRLRVLQRSPSAFSSDFAPATENWKSEDNLEEALVTGDLPPKQKLVFTLRDIEELDVAEVISITGMTAEQIKHNLYQARKQIRAKIHQIETDL